MRKNMTRIKFCGLRRPEDIEAVNRLGVSYVGFVFAPSSRRCVSHEQAAALKSLLLPSIRAVGVFVDEDAEEVARLLEAGIIDIAQLHGSEDEAYVQRLKKLTVKPVIRAFRIQSVWDLRDAQTTLADGILLDAGAGDGRTFEWTLLRRFERPYFLAGGLTPENVELPVRRFRPFAVDVSSGIETDGYKDPEKMAAFAAAVRRADQGYSI